ncbi:leukocyte elastase inhibitor-like [Ornithodoros turicata]|uniref:leukocyte elastase inhibitor-like n=1 Tax=Ornithodoros turicata TaxID=34597 RepID=UPI003139EF6C
MACIPTTQLLNFGLDIYKHIELEHASESGNVFFSPFSIAAALAMTVAGARGNTAEEIMSAMRLASDFPLQKHFSQLRDCFKRFTQDTTLHIANRIFLDKTFIPLQDFCKLLNDVYDSTTVSVNFRSDAEGSREQINFWVAEATKGKIRDLLPHGVVDGFTTLVLVNAVYFKGPWDRAFKESFTTETKFYETSQISRKVEMMFQIGRFEINRCKDLKVTSLTLPYKGNDMAMVILLPDDIEGLTFLEAALTPQKFESLVFNTAAKRSVHLYLPKFKLEQETTLKSVLRKMGMQQAFEDAADLTGISACNDIKVSEVVHKAFVEVNEEGTEAAAATGVVIQQRCMGVRQDKIFKADHPFMFSIITTDPREVLFLGSLRRP